VAGKLQGEIEQLLDTLRLGVERRIDSGQLPESVAGVE
jgi:hypothetical protein